MLSLEQGAARRGDAAARSRATRSAQPGRSRSPVDDGELAAAIVEHAYLEGDFVLRSGQRSQLLPRQVPLRDTAGPARGARRADRGGGRRASSPRRCGSPGPSSAPSRSRPPPSLRIRPPVPDRAQGGEGATAPTTASRARSSRARRVCLVEDVVTSGGAAIEAVEALRAAGLRCRTAVCVVDREEGGVDALARLAVRIRPLYPASMSQACKSPAKPAWLSGTGTPVRLRFVPEATGGEARDQAGVRRTGGEQSRVVAARGGQGGRRLPRVRHRSAQERWPGDLHRLRQVLGTAPRGPQGREPAQPRREGAHPGRTVPKFSAGSALKSAVKGGGEAEASRRVGDEGVRPGAAQAAFGAHGRPFRTGLPAGFPGHVPGTVPWDSHCTRRRQARSGVPACVSGSGHTFLRDRTSRFRTWPGDRHRDGSALDGHEPRIPARSLALSGWRPRQRWRPARSPTGSPLRSSRGAASWSSALTPSSSCCRSSCAATRTRDARRLRPPIRASAGGSSTPSAPYVVAVKPQSAFFEALGADGIGALEDVCDYARAAGLLVIADAKRGDIGSTARAYASAYLEPRNGNPPLADALTVNPYLGRDSLEPFLAACRRHGGGALLPRQDVERRRRRRPGSEADGRHARLAPGRGAGCRLAEGIVGECGLSSVGAVVGATYPRAVTEARKLLPQSILLLPGVGAQGATAADVARAFTSGPASGLVTVSRSVIYAFRVEGAEWRTAAAAEAARLRGEVWRASGW